MDKPIIWPESKAFYLLQAKQPRQEVMTAAAGWHEVACNGSMSLVEKKPGENTTAQSSHWEWPDAVNATSRLQFPLTTCITLILFITLNN